MRRLAALCAVMVLLALSAQTWGAPQTGQRGELVLAEYGRGNRLIDVTERVSSPARGDVLSFRVDDATLAVTSRPGSESMLRILVLTRNGQVRWLTFRENQDVNLRGYTFNVARFGELRIIRATYGTNVRSNDVTNRLTSQIRDGQISMAVNNSTMGGDPDHDRPKTLTVSYSLNGREDQISVPEGGYLNLPRGGVGSRYDLRIIRATYGTSRRSNDVTTRLAAEIRDGRISMAVNNTTMGGDPDHDRPKTLTVIYSLDGREDQISVPEGGYLDLPSGSLGSRLISSGTQLSIRTNEAIDSKTAREGQRFSAVVEQDVLDNTGALAIPKGSDVDLIIRSAGESELILDVDSIVVAGRRYSLSTEDLQRKGGEGIGANKRTGVMVGGGAALGALIGAIVGGGKGAAIGAVIGAAGGAGVQVLTKGKEVNVPSETVLNFRLEQDLYLSPLP